MRLVSRTIDVLRLLAQTPDGVGVTKLAEQLGESPSTVHRLLAALLEHDYVAQTDDRRYRLGVGVLGLAHAFQRQDRLVSMARPHLSKLATQTRESVFLAERIGDDVVCVASAESPRLVSFFLRLGQRTPYHAAASARAILAFQEPAEQRRLLEAEGFVPFTDKTPVKSSRRRLGAGPDACAWVRGLRRGGGGGGRSRFGTGHGCRGASSTRASPWSRRMIDWLPALDTQRPVSWPRPRGESPMTWA